MHIEKQTLVTYRGKETAPTSNSSRVAGKAPSTARVRVRV